MRTETIVTTYEIYTFDELSADAKERVKEWYLNNQPEEIFTEMCKEDLNCLFGENDLNVQYSLASCQGDGFNIYGRVDAKSIIKCLENHNGGMQLEQFEKVLTDKEKKTILHYSELCGDIKIPWNNHYCYSLADRIDIKDEWEYQLEDYHGYKNINIALLGKFENLVREIFGTLCKSYEKQGYEFFYEVSEVDLEEFCEANG